MDQPLTHHTPQATRHTPQVVRSLLLVGVIAGAVIAIDRLCKQWIVAQLGPAAPTHRQPIIPGILELDYGQNRGAAFGLFPDAGWLLGLIALAVSVGILYAVPRLAARPGGAPWPLLLGLSLILGGAIGNLWDRAVFGYVVDFITPTFARLNLGGTLWRFPTFNTADSAITLGVLTLLVVGWFLGEAAPETARPSSTVVHAGDKTEH